MVATPHPAIPDPTDVRPPLNVPDAAQLGIPTKLSDLATRSGFGPSDLAKALGGESEAAPTHQYSSIILNLLWPVTSTQEFYDASVAQRQHASNLREHAADIRFNGEQVATQNSGKIIDAWYEANYRDAIAVDLHADMWEVFSELTQEAAEVIDFCREQLTTIDLEAHQEIEDARMAARISPPALANAKFGIALAEILPRSRARAERASAAAVVEMERLCDQVIAAPGPDQPTPESGSDTEQLNFSAKDGPAPRDHGARDLDEAPRSPLDDRLPTPTGEEPGADRIDPTDVTDSPGIGEAAHAGTTFSDPQSPLGDRRLEDGTRQAPAAPSLIPGVGSAAGIPLSGSGLGSMPTPPKLPSLGSPLSGLSSPLSAFANPAAASPLGSPTAQLANGSFNPGADFARGITASLNTSAPAASWVPPVADVSPAASVQPPVAPQPIPSSSGAPPAAVAPSAPAAASAPAGQMGTPMVAPPMSPSSTGWAPYGTDVARGTPLAAPPAPTVAPAMGASPAAPVGPPLPAGAVGSSVGASLGAGAAAGQASTEDPLLQLAVRQVYELLHASRLSPGLEWCVGVFETPSGIDVVAVSNDGAGYIPVGLFMPRSVRPLFEDPLVDKHFRGQWFGWANPATTMVAYADFLIGRGARRQLHAVAVSADLGGSSLPAHRAGVPWYQECTLLRSPISADLPAPALDADRAHRLELVDRHQYVRLADSVAASKLTELWQLTTGSMRWALEHASTVPGVAIDQVVWDMFRAMDRRQSPDSFDETMWLSLGSFSALTSSTATAMQPGRMESLTDATVLYHALHNLVRVCEVLTHWRVDSYIEVAYAVHQIDVSRETLAHQQ